MPDPSSLQWLTVTDFSGGIRQQSNSDVVKAFSPQPVGSAAAVDSSGVPVTFDCMAIASGGIGPVPFAFSGPNVGGGLPQPDAGTIGGPGYYWIGGLHVPQYPIVDNSGGFVAYGYDAASLLISINYIDSAANHHKYRLYRWDAFRSNIVEINNNAGAPPFHDRGVTTDLTHGGFTPLCDYRSSGAALPTNPGNPYVIVGVCDPSVLGTRIYQYPKPGFAGQVGNYVLIKNPTHLLSHQGRLFVNGYDSVWTLDGAVTTLVHNDDNFWTVANQDTYDNGGTSSSLTQATVGSYGTFGSASASELIAIRATSFGGMTVASDLNDPIITDYAGIQGTNGIHVNGCWTPMGFVYGTQFGSVHTYVGGGHSQDLAPEMEGGFWHETLNNDMGQSVTNGMLGNPPVMPHYGKFAYHNGFVFVPGNWLYDMTNNTWWRFKTPNVAIDNNNEFGGHWFATSPFGRIYCAPSHWETGHVVGSGAMFAKADFEGSTPTQWQWTSQLIPISQGSEINEVNEFIIEGLAQYNSLASCTLGVTLTSYPNGTTINLPLASWTEVGTPKIFRRSVPADIRGTHVSVKIIATNSDTTHSAPIVLRFDLGINQVSKVPMA